MKILGFDTETINGKCRLIGLSNGTHFIVRSWEDIALFMRRCDGLSLVAFNADYDIQSLMVYLPKAVQIRLVKGIPTEYEGFMLYYVPKKYFRFDNNWIYDVFQFYGMGLNRAAKKYLGEQKLDVDSSQITEENIYTPKVIEYCIQDAVLVSRLFLKFHESLPKELKKTKPISPAFYSFHYFKDEITGNKLSKAINNLIRPAFHGGRFEILEKGPFKNLHVYDVTSAYPHEIMQLHSIKGADFLRVPQYLPNATYSFYYIKVHIPDKFVSPLCFKNKTLCIYPVGDYEGLVTKKEYEAVMSLNPKIEWGFHAFCPSNKPFAEKMSYVFKKKSTEQNPLAWKLIANSCYGRTCMKTPKWTGDAVIDEEILNTFTDEDGNIFFQYEDIGSSNFIYASEITANTRLRMYESIKRWPDAVVAVQTDSLISKKPLPLPVSLSLGEWKEEIWEEAYLIGSGVYFYKTEGEWKCKFRGFNFRGEMVENLLDRIFSSNEKTIEFESVKRYSIQESLRLHNDEVANQILQVGKKLNLNFDRKRVWLDSWKSGKELRTKRISSLAIPLLNA